MGRVEQRLSRAHALRVVDVQGDHGGADVVRQAHRLGVHHAQRQVARLELGEVAIRAVHRARQLERRAEEFDGRIEVVRRQRNEVDAAHQLRGGTQSSRSFAWERPA